MKRRKPSKAIAEPAKKPERLLFFDVIRIVCVALIVYDHGQLYFLQGLNRFLFADGNGPFDIYSAGAQGFAVYGMILVSGAVLEYNYRGLERMSEYSSFLFRRLIRLYPAFWMSLVLGIILFPAVLQQNIGTVLFEFTGFFVVLGQGPGNINIMGWFIAAIVCLYILYPWLSRFIKKYQLWGLAGLCLLSWGARSLVLMYNLIPLDSFWRWFPIFNAFEFCLGIYLVQSGMYPKKENTYPIIHTLADLSFYVFILHVVINNDLFGLDMYMLSPLISADMAIAMGNQLVVDGLYWLEAMGTILIVSYIVMRIDNRFQRWIRSLYPG